VIAYEIVHNLHKTKKPGVIIKLDYEKHMIGLILTFSLKYSNQEALERLG
jgi:hypothetical protein